jgi:hypothetical protein
MAKVQGKFLTIDPKRKVKIIAIRPIHKKFRKPIYVVPVYNGREYVTGFDYLSDADKAKYKHIMPEDLEASSANFTDGKTLDLSIDQDVRTYLYAITDQRCAMSADKVVSDTHDYYIFDAEEKAEKESEKYSVIVEAVEFVSKLSSKELLDLGMHLGFNAQTSSANVVRANVHKLVSTDPKTIMEFKNATHPKRLLFASKAFMYNVVHIESNGVYFGTDYIAANKSEMISILFDNQHQALLSRLQNAVGKVDNPYSENNVVETVDDKAKEEIQKKADEQVNVQRLLFEYYKLTGKDYKGDDNSAAIDRSIKKFEATEKKVTDFLEKEYDIAGLKQSATRRKLPEEEILKVGDDEEQLRELIIKHIRA